MYREIDLGLKGRAVNRKATGDAMRISATERQEPVEPGGVPPAGELLPLVYEELRKLAAHKMAQEAPGQTLQPTALVHEAWLRLGADAQPAWANRAHFFAAAAEAMRRILVERARRHTALKRGRRSAAVSTWMRWRFLWQPPMTSGCSRWTRPWKSLPLCDPRKAELVKLRYFTGMSFEEAASVLGIAVPTAKEWWAYGRAWLAVALRRST